MDITCPRGHRSATTDYCDQCGTPITDAEVSSATQVRPVVAQTGEPCPECGTPRTRGDRYCEVDGYDFDDPSAPTAVWCAFVTSNRARFEALHDDELVFPEDARDFSCVLESETVSVGRRSPSRDIFPDIDLGDGFEDPGVSREHLRFERIPSSGAYAVVDCGSANGTTLNDDPVPIPPHAPIPVNDGDRIHLGAWTTITVRRTSA